MSKVVKANTDHHHHHHHVLINILQHLSKKPIFQMAEKEMDWENNISIHLYSWQTTSAKEVDNEYSNLT